MADIEVARLTARDSTKAAFDSVRKSIASLESSGSRLRGIFATLGVGLSAGAFAGFVKSSIDAADGLNKMSQRVGVSVEELSKLQYAAKLSDITTEQLGDGLRKLSVNLQDAGRGGGEAVQAFKALGFSQQELTRLNADQALKRIAQAFSRIEDGAGKTALAVQIFGRSGSDLIPLLNAGAGGLKQFGDEAQRLGQVVSGEAGNNAGRKLLEVETRLKAVRDDLTKLRGTFGDSDFARAILGLSRVKDLEVEESDLVATRDRLKKLQGIRAERVTAEAAPGARLSKAPVVSCRLSAVPTAGWGLRPQVVAVSRSSTRSTRAPTAQRSRRWPAAAPSRPWRAIERTGAGGASDRPAGLSVAHGDGMGLELGEGRA